MKPDQCLMIRGANPERIDALVAAGRLDPGNTVEIKRYMAYLRDGARGEDWAEVYARHYPEDAGRAAMARPSKDVAKEEDRTRERDGGNRDQ
jgi:hypothetical protein